ncbi:MAG: sensor histidine kinase, partial [Verrucomicrobia bacterium]|nr:sensor histidine kinase [Verrucomicrobiota bacterium]
RAWSVVAGLVALIGLLDYASGINVSLAVLYLVPVSLATGWLGLYPGLMLALVCTLVRVGSDSLIVLPHALPLHTWWNAAATLAIMLWAVWLLHALLSLHRNLAGEVAKRTTELEESIAERQRLERQILDVSDRERNAFGRELHDELGQHFVATALATQVLAQTLGDKPGAAEARSIAGWIEEGIAKTRKLARGLLLAQIEPERLPQELEELARGVSRAGLRGRMVFRGTPIAATAADCAQLFRIAQEAVSNVLHHANATTVQILLVSDADALCLSVVDDGQGIPEPPTGGRGLGLRIMEHRARLIGASFSLVSEPDAGTTLTCRLPGLAPLSP